MGSVFLKFIAGAAAGLLTGLLTEPFAPTTLNAAVVQDGWQRWEQTTILLLGALVGGFVGGLDGLTKGGAVWIWRGIVLGALFGMIGSTLGSGLGGSLANGLLGSSWTIVGHAQIIGRVLVFAFMGVFVGAAIGASSLNPRKALQGAIGGLVGGAISGVLFDIIGAIIGPVILTMRHQTEGEVGGPSRIVGWIVLGGMVALMIGLVDRLTRSAWLRADYGRNEFKEWPLDAAQNFIGRGETCHVILRGDPQVAPVHASIARQGGHFVLSDAGTPLGTLVNGHRVGQVSLNPGDVIGIGGAALRFMTKSAQVAYAPHMGAPYPQAPPSPNTHYPLPPTTPYGVPTQAFPTPPTTHPSPLTLLAIDGPLAGRRFPVAAPLEIGREASGIALVGDANASRRHARVVPGPVGLQVDDLGSTNGTYVDGQRVGSAVARPGTTVRVGSTTFRVE